MADLLVFDPEDNLLSILSDSADEACQFWDAPYKEVVNNGSFFEFTAQGDHEDSKHLIAENQVAFLDKDGVFRLFVIKEPNQTNDLNGPIIHCLCESAMNELNEEIIEDIRPYNSTLRNALIRALSETRWEVGETADLGINSTNFYYINVSEAIESIINIWGGELRDRIVVQDNKIIGRYIDILPRRGQDTGKLWEIDKDILYLSHKVQSYPKTALYGRGSSLEIEDEEGNATGGFTRKISFADVEWKISSGDPVDKPKGQTWVGDLQALAQYGKLNKDGSRRHRKGIYENGEQEDPEALLQETWKALQQEKKQLHNYEMDVFLLEKITGHEHEKVRLGDTTYAIDRSFTNPVEVEERVIAFEYDVAAPDNSGYVELGQYIDLYSDEDRLDQIESKLNDKSGIWDKGGGPVTDNKVENITPSKTLNVIASGGHKQILVEWDFVGTIHIANYEVYASQIQGFTPDSSNLVFRGKTGTYTHTADNNQQWYFRVRAINTHGVSGPFSDEAMAQTVRIISEDILFDPDFAAELRELEIIADNSLDLIKLSNEAREQIQAQSKQYTDAEIKATEVSLMLELANKAGVEYVDGKIYLVNEELLNKVDNGVYQNKMLGIDSSLDGLSVRTENVEANIDTLTNEVDSTVVQIANIDIKANQISQNVSSLSQTVNEQGTALSRAESSIDLLSDEIELKTQEIDILGDRMTRSESSIRLLSDDIELKVDKDGIIGAINVQPGTAKIQARLVDISDGTNLVDNGTFEDDEIQQANKVNGWINFNPDITTFTVYDQTSWANQTGSNKVLVLFASDQRNVDVAQEKYIKVKEGDEFYFEAEYRNHNLIGNGTFNIGFRSYDGKKNHVQWGTAVIVSEKTYSWTKVSGSYKIPAGSGVQYVQVRLTFSNNGETTNRVFVDNIVVRRKNNSNLIVDGAITANLMAANSITAQNGALANASITRLKLQDGIVGTLQIENGAITNVKIANATIDDAKIANVSVDKLKAGILDASKVKVFGGSTTDYASIDGSFVELRGRYRRTWRNSTTTHDVKTRLQNGHLRFRNDSLNRSLYLSEFGISTYVDGEGEGAGSSGSIIWWDRTYSPSDANGLTINSYGGVVALESDLNRIVLNANQSVNLESATSPIIFRPYRDNRGGTNVFMMTVAESSDSSQTHGYVMYGSEDNRSVGLRFHKGSSAKTIEVVDGNYASGGSTIFDSGILQANTVRKRDGSGSVYWNGSGTGTTSGTDLTNTFYASGIRARIGDSNIFLATNSGGSVHVTNFAGYNNGNGITYMDIYASDFKKGSSRAYKTNITPLDQVGLKVVNSLTIVEYDLKTDIQYGRDNRKSIGVIAEDSPAIATSDGKAINPSEMSAYNTKAIQELFSQSISIIDEQEWLRLENSYLKQRVDNLEKRVNILEAA